MLLPRHLSFGVEDGVAVLRLPSGASPLRHPLSIDIGQHHPSESKTLLPARCGLFRRDLMVNVQGDDIEDDNIILCLVCVPAVKSLNQGLTAASIFGTADDSDPTAPLRMERDEISHTVGQCKVRGTTTNSKPRFTDLFRRRFYGRRCDRTPDVLSGSLFFGSTADDPNQSKHRDERVPHRLTSAAPLIGFWLSVMHRPKYASRRSASVARRGAPRRQGLETRFPRTRASRTTRAHAG